MALPPLLPGDRFPDLSMLDHTARPLRLSGEVKGKPLLVLATPSMAEGEGKELLGLIAGARDDFQVFVVTGQSPEVLAGLVPKDSRAPVLYDREGDGLAYFLTKADGTQAGLAGFALDCNQRVLSVKRGSALEVIPALLEVLEVYSQARGEGVLISQAAPALIVPHVFEPQFCDRLIALWDQDHVEGKVYDGTVNALVPDMKSNREHLVRDPQLYRQIEARLRRRLAPELQKAFLFNEPYKFESFIILGYSDTRTDYFAIHRDRYHEKQPRRFAMTLNLNEGYEGGELRFPEYGPHRFKAPRGGACVFSCWLLHEALPVTKGERRVMTAFFNTPEGANSTGIPGI